MCIVRVRLARVGGEHDQLRLQFVEPRGEIAQVVHALHARVVVQSAVSRPVAEKDPRRGRLGDQLRRAWVIIDMLVGMQRAQRLLDQRVEAHLVADDAHGQHAADARDGAVEPRDVAIGNAVFVHVAAAGGGGRFGLAYFDQACLTRFVDEAVGAALTNLQAQPAPAGEMTVVLGSGWPGILLHEAIGHGLEGDFNRKGSSAFSGRIGKRVAAKGVTVLDDGTLPDRRGSLNVDDEGNTSQRNVLIEDGILKGYIQDAMNARLMGVKPTGNGRRESYAHVPMPRMTNTYMLGGDKSAEEIVASLQKGLYAVNFGGGQVDITSGKFVFSASQAYWVENGKIQYPVKGATLVGNGPDALTRVSLIGNDMALDSGVGTCGKEGQSVPVGVGQPTLRIDGLTVGGTA